MIKKKAIKKYNYIKNAALILACGESKRFRLKSPKQYIEFFDDIILNHTIKIFLKNRAISYVLFSWRGRLYVIVKHYIINETYLELSMLYCPGFPYRNITFRP